jgi:hypothetical protein
VETLEDGWNVLVGAHRSAIVEALGQGRPAVGRKTSYGDDNVSERMLGIIEAFLR